VENGRTCGAIHEHLSCNQGLTILLLLHQKLVK